MAASVAGIGMAVIVAGCASAGSSAGNAASPAAPAGGTAPGTAASPASVAPASPPVGSQQPHTAAPSCRTADLKVVKGSVGAAAGSVYLQIDFTNTSGTPCTLYGYPGVALTTAMSATSQVGAAATRSTAQPTKLVTLAPNASASATLRLVQVANYPTASCGPVSGSFLQVYPPGQQTAVYLQYQGRTCTKPVFSMGIGAIQPGASA